MSQLTLTQALLRNLAGRIPPDAGRVYMTKEAAREKLVELTGRDFGLDVAAWKQWLAQNPLSHARHEQRPKNVGKKAKRPTRKKGAKPKRIGRGRRGAR